jgi:uncharacterized membrane protein YkvA (DUF1232 family)
MRAISVTLQEKARKLRDALAGKFDEKEAKEFAPSHRKESWYDDFAILYEMIASSDYSITRKTKFIIAGTLAYVVTPIDVIPDFIAVAGWLDDTFVLSLAMSALREEIESFKLFRIGGPR